MALIAILCIGRIVLVNSFHVLGIGKEASLILTWNRLEVSLRVLIVHLILFVDLDPSV